MTSRNPYDRQLEAGDMLWFLGTPDGARRNESAQLATYETRTFSGFIRAKLASGNAITYPARFFRRVNVGELKIVDTVPGDDSHDAQRDRKTTE